MTQLNVTRRHLRSLMLIFCSILLITIFYGIKHVSAKEKSAPAQQVDVGNVVVEVNGIKITQNEIDAKIKTQLESMKVTQHKDEFEKYKRFLEQLVIKTFITRTLINQEINRQNIVVSEDKIKEQVNEVRARVPRGMSLETILKERGSSIEELRENITYSLKMNKLFESQLKLDYTPTDQEIKKYYNTNKKKFDIPEVVRLRQIFIKLDEKDDGKIKAEKKRKIEALRKQLLEGADFQKLAKENSEGPNKETGGVLVLIRGRTLNLKPFEDAAFSQKVNEIGPIVKTRLGYHIIQVLAHNKGEERSFDEVKDEVRKEMIQEKNRKAINNYIAGLYKKAKIVYHNADAIKTSREINIVGSPFRGPSDAPVVIVEFGDFQCQSCAKASFLLDQILEMYPKKVKIVFKNYPLEYHKYARIAAAAALAAGKQGKFWEFHDLLFENQEELNDQKIKEISESLSLDWRKLSKDMKKPAVLAMINSDKSEADRVGIDKVPTIFINGKRLKDITLPGIKAVIEKELQK